MKAILVLENGAIFSGRAFSGAGEVCAPLVYNSNMMGYQEAITDPGHHGRMLCFTYPLIGSYGVNEEDSLSALVHTPAILVKEYVGAPRNFRATASLADLLARFGILGVEGVDTRAITRLVSQHGPMKAILSTQDLNPDSLLAKLSNFKADDDLLSKVTCQAAMPANWSGQGRFKVALLDLGARRSLLETLKQYDMDIIQLPAASSARQILELKPQGLVVSGGPGNPNSQVTDTLKELLGQMPIWGIGLGFLSLALALGGKLEKLLPGHFNGSQTILDLGSGRIGVSDQNILWTLDENVLAGQMQITYRSQIDDSAAGFVEDKLALMATAFNPETGGAGDEALFVNFVSLMEQS